MKRVNYKSRCKRNKSLFIFKKILEKSHKYTMEQIHPWLTFTESVLKTKATQRATQWSNILLTQKGKLTDFIYFNISCVFCLLLQLIINSSVMVTSQPYSVHWRKSEWLESWECEFLPISMHKSLLLILSIFLLLFKKPKNLSKNKINNYHRTPKFYLPFWLWEEKGKKSVASSGKTVVRKASCLQRYSCLWPWINGCATADCEKALVSPPSLPSA